MLLWFDALPGRGASCSTKPMRLFGLLRSRHTGRHRAFLSLPPVSLLGATLAICTLPLGAMAQHRVFPADTIRLPAAEVRAPRTAGQWATGARLTTLDSARLRERPFATLADVVGPEAGIFLKHYGPGQLASVALRGTSARHTAIIWRGFAVNLPTAGETDLAFVPVQEAGRVTVQHGPAGATFGTGAVGGAILLDAPAPPAPGFRARMQQALGAFGYAATAASASWATAHGSVVVNGWHRAARNDFPLRFREFGTWVTRRQTDAALWQRGASLDAHYALPGMGTVAVAGWWSYSDRQLSPTLGAASAHARQLDATQRLVLEWTSPTARAGLTTVRAGFFRDRLDYHDDNFTSPSRTDTWQAQVEHSRALGRRLTGRVGVEAQQFRAAVPAYGTALLTQQRASLFALLHYQPTERLTLSLNARQAAISGLAAPPLAPTLGLAWRALVRQRMVLTIKGSASGSYRAPTLNERYYQPGGNPLLRPERGRGAEAGVQMTTSAGSFSTETELTAYQQRIRDWVRWAPARPGDAIWSPLNLLEVQTRGLEATTRLDAGTARRGICLRLSYTLTQAWQHRATRPTEVLGQQLIYVPMHTLAGSLESRWHHWRARLDGQWYSQRFVQPDHGAALPAYGLLDLTLARAVLLPVVRLDFTATLCNLTDVRYQSVAARPMPGRSWQVSVAVASTR